MCDKIGASFEFANLAVVARRPGVAICRATLSMMGSPILVKIVPGPTADTIPVHDGAQSRLFREADVFKRLRHRSIVPVIATGVLDDHSTWLAREWIDGILLSDLLRERGPLSLQHALDVTIEIGEVLCAAHDKRVSHERVSASNVFVVGDNGGPMHEGVRLLGFGGATFVPLSESVDTAAEVRGLGLLFYEAASGQTVCGYPKLPTITAFGVPVDLAAEIHRAITDSDLRHPTMLEFVSELRRLRKCLERIVCATGRAPRSDSPTSPMGVAALSRVLDEAAVANRVVTRSRAPRAAMPPSPIRGRPVVAVGDAGPSTLPMGIRPTDAAVRPSIPKVREIVKSTATAMVVRTLSAPALATVKLPPQSATTRKAVASIENVDATVYAIPVRPRKQAPKLADIIPMRAQPLRPDSAPRCQARTVRATRRGTIANVVGIVAAAAGIIILVSAPIARRRMERMDSANAAPTHVAAPAVRPVETHVLEVIPLPVGPSAAPTSEPPPIASTKVAASVVPKSPPRLRRVDHCPQGLVGCVPIEAKPEVCPPGLYPPGCLPLIDRAIR